MSMMKGFSNVFRIPELRKKIFITLGLVAVCRFVSHVPTPGVDWNALQAMFKGASGTAVHNMNLLFGLAETVGLQLKPSAF